MKLVIALVALSGCASWIDDKAASSTYRIVEKSMKSAQRQTDLQLAREAMPSGILQLAGFAESYPDHRGFKVLHANSVCQYAVTFVFDDWEDASLGGRDTESEQIAARLDGLLTTCITEQRALLPANWKLETTTRDQADAVLWLATAGAVQLALAPLKNFGQLPTIRAQLEKCAQLAPATRNADAVVLLGTLQAGQASFVGGDDGNDYFKRAKKLVGKGVLNVDVMFARGVAVARKDRALFTSTLEGVLAADLSRWPEQRLANEVARKKARRYLAAADKLF